MHYTGRNVLDHHPNKGQLEVYWSMKDFDVPEPTGGAPKTVDYGTKVNLVETTSREYSSAHGASFGGGYHRGYAARRGRVRGLRSSLRTGHLISRLRQCRSPERTKQEGNAA